MTTDDKKRFLELMNGCASSYSKQMEKNAISIFWDFLKDYDIGDVEKAFRQHLRASKFFPTIAEIIEHIPNANAQEHIGADEAWIIAKTAMNPNSSVCATNEILQAFDTVQAVYSNRDENPARMAFREAYNRIVKASGIKPRWFMSVGEDKAQAEAVALKAVQLGRLPAGAADKYRIEAPTTTVTKLIEGYVSKTTAEIRQDAMAGIKLSLVSSTKKPREKITLTDDQYAEQPWYLKETQQYSHGGMKCQ